MTNHTPAESRKKRTNPTRGKVSTLSNFGSVYLKGSPLNSVDSKHGWCGSGSNVQFAEIACLRPTTTTIRKTVTTGARVSARRGPFQPLKDSAQRQQRDRTYGTVGESIGEGMWAVNWDGMPPKREAARALRVEPDNACPLTPATTHNNNAQRVIVRIPFQPPRLAVQIPGAGTESALLIPIIT
jgi:hypothetical protein